MGIKKGMFKLGICRYFNLHKRIKFERRKSLMMMREEYLKQKLELAHDRDEFLQRKLGIVKNLIDYQLQLNAVSETQIKIIGEFLGQPVMDKIRNLQINIADSDIEKVTLNQTQNDQKTKSMGEQTGDP